MASKRFLLGLLFGFCFGFALFFSSRSDPEECKVSFQAATVSYTF